MTLQGGGGQQEGLGDGHGELGISELKISGDNTGKKESKALPFREWRGRGKKTLKNRVNNHVGLLSAILPELVKEGSVFRGPRGGEGENQLGRGLVITGEVV